MNFKVFALYAINFLAPDRENQIKTIHCSVRGTVTAETEQAARESVEREIEAGIDREYPVRWNWEITFLKLIQI